MSASTVLGGTFRTGSGFKFNNNIIHNVLTKSKYLPQQQATIGSSRLNLFRYQRQEFFKKYYSSLVTSSSSFSRRVAYNNSNILNSSSAILRRLNVNNSHMFRRSFSLSKDEPSLSDRLKTLFRKYGWASIAIYIALSAIDFGLIFIVMLYLGAEHVRSLQDWILEKLHLKRAHSTSEQEAAQRQHDNETSPIWTTAALAYTVHKTAFLPIRLGLTAWLTPPIVKTLQAWGYRVGHQAATKSSSTALLPFFVVNRNNTKKEKQKEQ